MTVPRPDVRTGKVLIPTTWVALAAEVRRLSGSEDFDGALKGDPRCWEAMASFVSVSEALATLVLEVSESKAER